MIYSMRYNVPRLLSVGDPEFRGTDYVFGVKDESTNILHTFRAAAFRASCLQQSGDIIPHAVNQCFSKAGPRPSTGPLEVLLEFVILVF